MKTFLLGLSLGLCAFLPLKADELDDAFAEWKGTVEASSKMMGELQVVTFDREKGHLTVAKELQLNETRRNTLVQTVPVKVLRPEAEWEGAEALREPWLKLRCNGNQKRVKTRTRVILEGMEVQELSKDEEKAFLVVSCHRADLKKARLQAERFLALAAKPGHP